MTQPAPVEWHARLRGAADVAPLRPRVPLWVPAGGADDVSRTAMPAHAIGSVEPGLLRSLDLPPLPDGRPVLQDVVHGRVQGWQVNGDLTASLAIVAAALRDAGLAGTWRNEQLAVDDTAGRRLGTVERAAVRALGIPTSAVHLAAVSPDGRHWVQQRALDKANDPGLWDTLMGGMVSARDTLDAALERETWEEAGLRPGDLRRLRHGGRIATRRPAGDAAGVGYVVEHIDWFACTLADGTEPRNQDGEVLQFALVTAAELREQIAAGQFTLEAALVLRAAGL